MKERIAQIIQKEDMTAAQFAEKIGISPSSLSHILSGRNNPSLEVVMKIHKACDYISLDWLLYGEGQMETDVDSDNNIHYTPSLFDENSLFTPERSTSPEYRKENEVKTPLYSSAASDVYKRQSLHRKRIYPILFHEKIYFRPCGYTEHQIACQLCSDKIDSCQPIARDAAGPVC